MSGKVIDKQKSPYVRREIKVLLLGAGESGKSTFLKQMRIIHGQDYSKEGRESYKDIIYSNIIRNLRWLVTAMGTLGIQWGDLENEKHAAKIMNCDEYPDFDTREFVKYVPSCKALWKDSGIQDAYARRIHPAELVKYFLDDIDRVGQREYKPSRQDILYEYVKTTGFGELVVEVSHGSKSAPFRFLDTGGQRSERKKWIHGFPHVTAVVFFVSTSAFDERLAEDEETNRMEESVNLFASVYNNKWFRRVAVILFLNKSDQLEEKVKMGVNIQKWFPDFKGDPTKLEDVQQFILAMYDARREDRNKAFFHHFTTAVDTDNIKKVFDAVHDIILEENLKITFGQRGGRADED